MKSLPRPALWVTLGAISTVLPDADVIGFRYGVAYGHWLGHRGFSHSICFAVLWSALLIMLFARTLGSYSKWKAFMFLFLCTLSHGLLDALTNGGLGVAFFSPFNNHRYFFPWRPVQVSPIGVEGFFTERGWNVLKSEALWIGMPALVLGVLGQITSTRRHHP